MQRPQLMQRWRRRTNSGAGDWLSGLWHQAQLSGQPFMKTVRAHARAVVEREALHVEDEAGLHHASCGRPAK